MSNRKQHVLCVTVGFVFAVAHFFLSLLSFFDTVFGAVAPSHGPNYGAMFASLTFPGSVVLNLLGDHLYGNDGLFFGTMAGNSILWGVIIGLLCHRVRILRKQAGHPSRNAA